MMSQQKVSIDMDRRKFIKLIAALPLFLVGRDAQSAQVPKSSPPKREVVLLEAMIAGWQYHQGDQIWHLLKSGAPLTLVREPRNPHDEMAIAVYAGRVKLGYVPRIHNTVIAGLIDQNVPIKARVLEKHKTPHPWEKMVIRITMAG